MKSCTADDNDGFPAFSAQLRNLLLPEKFNLRQPEMVGYLSKKPKLFCG
jgi:hypothetical protein